MDIDEARLPRELLLVSQPYWPGRNRPAGILLRPLGKNAHEAYKHTEKGPVHQRVIRQFRVRVEAIALKEETIGEGTSAVAGNLLSHNPATHLWNPVLEVNPHSAEVGWIRHGANRSADRRGGNSRRVGGS